MPCTEKVSKPALCVLFFSLTVAKCFIYFASLSKILFTDQARVLLSWVSSSPQFPPAFAAAPPPSPHSMFSIFPSFLIHFLCITPLLSTSIYSALRLPIFHKHIFSLLSIPFLPFLLHFFKFLHPFIIPLFSPLVTSHPTQHFSSQ